MATKRAATKQPALAAQAAKTGTERNRATADDGGPAPTQFGKPELIVMMHDGAGLRVGHDSVASATGAVHQPLTRFAARAGVTLSPLFGPEDRVVRATAAASLTATAALPDLSIFYHVDAEAGRLEAFAEELRAIGEVAAAYVKPPGEPPVLNDMVPDAQDAPPATPDFSARQIYLDPAPAGIDARFAEVADFLGGVAERRPPAVTGEDGRTALAIALAADQAAAEGREIAL